MLFIALQLLKMLNGYSIHSFTSWYLFTSEHTFLLKISSSDIHCFWILSLQLWYIFCYLMTNFHFQEYFQSSAYPEGLNGSSYYGQLPVQQAHSTTPHEAPHSVSVTTGAGPGPGVGLPPTGPPITLPAGGLQAPIVRDLPITSNQRDRPSLPADIPKSIGEMPQ